MTPMNDKQKDLALTMALLLARRIDFTTMSERSNFNHQIRELLAAFDAAAEITRLRNLIREEQEKLREQLAAWKSEAMAWRKVDDRYPMTQGDLVSKARNARAATDAIEKERA